MTVQNGNITPMMAQYLDIKSGYADALLFYRMGDFYEMFFDDAVAASAALDIALTKRGKHLGQDIPMCGVPVHAAEGYLLSLIRKGFRVAVCEQTEDPAEAKKRGSKSVVRRQVVRLVTPGTLTEDSLLDARRNNYLAAFADVRGDGALAWVDISTGEFRVMSLARVQLGPQIARLGVRELLVAGNMEDALRDMAADLGAALTPLAPSSFDSTQAGARVAGALGVASLDGFGEFDRADLSAMGALVSYLQLTQIDQLPMLRPPMREVLESAMSIDAATQKNLVLIKSLEGRREGSLLASVDRCVTAAGARLLERRIAGPSRDISEITTRLDGVSALVDDPLLRGDLRDALRNVPDLDRALSRLSLGRGGPRDLTALRDGLAAAGQIAARLDGQDGLLGDACSALSGHDDLASRLTQTLTQDPPLFLRDGGVVAAGVDDDLDQARALRDDGRKVIAGMQATYCDESGVTALKIKHNNVLGYFIETPATHAEKMLSEPLSQTFIHRQTTANAVRFTTVELSELETRMLNAGNLAAEIEARVFEDLRQAVLARAGDIMAAASALAQVDLAAAGADLAAERNWTRPHLTDDRRFSITGGRHPVVEDALLRSGESPFVANGCDLTATADGGSIALLTGPNMAGKSTYLRQNALIAILAQAGMYVPADDAEIGVVSQIFSRVGASDDLARGRSTFMVEMVETAAILNQADTRALVILDEIGRGTATYDGLSIAWATLEHLHDVNRCRALFATHYHEMTALAARLEGLSNLTMRVREWEGEVIFLHEVASGTAQGSYGVQVARLAGLPASVIARAKQVLDMLEQGDRDGGASAATLIDDLPLFSAAPSQPAPPRKADGPSPVEKALSELVPDALSPREALDALYDLKRLLGDVPKS